MVIFRLIFEQVECTIVHSTCSKISLHVAAIKISYNLIKYKIVYDYIIYFLYYILEYNTVVIEDATVSLYIIKMSIQSLYNYCIS